MTWSRARRGGGRERFQGRCLGSSEDGTHLGDMARRPCPSGHGSAIRAVGPRATQTPSKRRPRSAVASACLARWYSWIQVATVHLFDACVRQRSAVSGKLIGARWWRFDFHAHSPASHDYGKGPQQLALQGRSPRQWLLDFMRAQVDCVAITDHNTAAWIDPLRNENLSLAQERPEGFRELHLFPGVEITVDGGVHLLAVFDPEVNGDYVKTFLGAAGLEQHDPDPCRHRTSLSLLQVSRLIVQHKGIAVPAHADRSHGVLSEYSGESLRVILKSPDILAAEVDDQSSLDSGPAGHHRPRWTAVLGSDSHHPSGNDGQAFPGSRFTWVKMGRPSIDGLRIALLDGAPLSVQRSVDFAQDPNSHADMVVRSLNVSEARFAGRGRSLEARFSPWMTAIIGGRGTGKSTLIEMMRLCLRREHDIPDELKSDLGRFAKIPTAQSKSGALTNKTSIAIVVEKDGISYRLQWDTSGDLPAIERQSKNGTWCPSSGDIRNRFPVEIFSQKHILSLARDRSSLLQLIDESDIVDGAKIANQRIAAETKFLRLKSQIRELKLQVEQNRHALGDLEDLNRKIELFEQGGHKKILIEFRRIGRQSRVIKERRYDLLKTIERIRDVAKSSEPLEIREEDFCVEDPAELEALEWIHEAVQAQSTSANELRNIATDLEQFNERWNSRLSEAYYGRSDTARSEYDALLIKLSGAGIKNPKEYSQLIHRRQVLIQRSEESASLELQISALEKEASKTLRKLEGLRLDLSEKRQNFLQEVLQCNPFVRITLIPFGDDSSIQESAFRKALSREDSRLAGDILSEDGSNGILAELYRNLPGYESASRVPEIQSRIRRIKASVLLHRKPNVMRTLSRWFENHIKNLTPEQVDRIELWQPLDSLKIEFQRPDKSGWSSIEDGSPGQRSAALLAFLLSYGEDPIILDQPEDDLDNRLIYDLIVRQIRESKRNRQVIVVTHNPNIVVNGHAEAVIAMDFRKGQCVIVEEGTGCLQDRGPREEVCRVMEGGLQAFQSRYERLAVEVLGVH